MTEHQGSSTPVAARGGWRRVVRRLLGPLVAIVATLYFLIDALFLLLLKPITAWLGRLHLLANLRDWVRALGPYSTLVVFLVPLIVLEPVKPVGLYLVGTGHYRAGTLVIVVGEILKVTLVERLFHLTRDKLMTIPTFAWGYGHVMRWLGYLHALPAWQAVLRRYGRIKAGARLTWSALKLRARRIGADLRRRWAALWIDPA